MKNVTTDKGIGAAKTHMISTRLSFSKEKNIWYTKMAGVGTQCKSHSIVKETFNEFHKAYKKYPETCCKKCAKSYLEMMRKGGKIK